MRYRDRQTERDKEFMLFFLPISVLFFQGRCRVGNVSHVASPLSSSGFPRYIYDINILIEEKRRGKQPEFRVKHSSHAKLSENRYYLIYLIHLLFEKHYFFSKTLGLSILKPLCDTRVNFCPMKQRVFNTNPSLVKS